MRVCVCITFKLNAWGNLYPVLYKSSLLSRNKHCGENTIPTLETGMDFWNMSNGRYWLKKISSSCETYSASPGVVKFLLVAWWKGVALRTRAQRALNKSNAKSTYIGVEFTTMKVASFNYDIQHAGKVVVQPRGVLLEGNETNFRVKLKHKHSISRGAAWI